MDRVTIKERARFLLSTYRGPSVGVYLLFTALSAVVGGVTFGFAALVLLPPLQVGVCIFFLGAWRAQQPPVESLFYGFRQYLQSLIALLWAGLLTFLWSLVFIIPGIVRALAYSLTPYLVAEYPNLEPRRAVELSMAITDGHKAEILVMFLSFLGWLLLSGLTFGILHVAYVGPYMQLSFAGLYESLLADALDRGVVTEADLIV